MRSCLRLQCGRTFGKREQIQAVSIKECLISADLSFYCRLSGIGLQRKNKGTKGRLRVPGGNSLPYCLRVAHTAKARKGNAPPC